MKIFAITLLALLIPISFADTKDQKFEQSVCRVYENQRKIRVIFSSMKTQTIDYQLQNEEITKSGRFFIGQLFFPDSIFNPKARSFPLVAVEPRGAGEPTGVISWPQDTLWFLSADNFELEHAGKSWWGVQQLMNTNAGDYEKGLESIYISIDETARNLMLEKKIDQTNVFSIEHSVLVKFEGTGCQLMPISIKEWVANQFLEKAVYFRVDSVHANANQIAKKSEESWFSANSSW